MDRAATCVNMDETSLVLGQLSGTWKDVYDRQDALYATYTAAVMKAWRKLVKNLDIAAAVALFRREAYMTSDGTPAPGTDGDAGKYRKAELRTLAAALATGLLAGTQDSPQLGGFLDAITSALRDSAGEGYASALAVAASAAGRDGGFDWDRAQADGQRDPGAGAAATVAAAITAAFVSAVRVAIVNAAVAGDDAAAMTKAVRQALANDRPAQVMLTHAMGTAISASALDLFRQYGTESAKWITAGDSRVCPVCSGYEAHGSYPLDELPACPDHFGCRCITVPSGRSPLPADSYSAYLAA